MPPITEPSTFSFFFTSSKVLIWGILIPMVTMGQILSADAIFLTMGLYNTVRLSMTLFFPFAITHVSEAIVSFSRIQDFLEREDVSEVSSDVLTVNQSETESDKPAVKCQDVVAKWNDKEVANTLENISFQVKKGELCAVIGPVGSGKVSRD